MIADEIQLTSDQKKAHDFVIDSIKSGKMLTTLGGYAGTGKTTLVKYIINSLAWEDIAYCAFTGKAASVLKSKVNLETANHCGTIHSLMYEPVKNKEGKIVGWKRRFRLNRRKFNEVEKEWLDYPSPKLIVIDEASMVNEQLINDLKSYGIPILAVGDHGQLPPVLSKFNLMEKPQVKLEQIMRQVEGNPIIKLSMMARNGELIKKGSYVDELGNRVDKISDFGVIYKMTPAHLSDYLFLSGTNATRSRMNRFVRKRLGFGTEGDETPVKGDTLICLKNNWSEGLFNGLTGKLIKIEPHLKHWYNAIIDIGDETPYEGKILKHQFGKAKTIREHKGLEAKEFGDLFDFGYCLTVHKAQGSESDKVILFDERIWGMDDKEYSKWLYTGITRAKKRLIIIGK